MKREKIWNNPELVMVVIVIMLIIGIWLTFRGSMKLENEAHAEAATHRQLSRSEQVRIMQECYKDTGKIINVGMYQKTESRVSMANLFFIYRTGMAINNNLVQPELSQWNDK